MSTTEKISSSESISNFTLLPRKGINIPNAIYDEELQYKIYNEFIQDTQNFNVDALGLSFVQTGKIIDRIRELTPHKLLISKIENTEGLRAYQDIVTSSDGIMIDQVTLLLKLV